MKFMRLTLCTSLFTLSSCSVYQQGFECEPGRGVGCKSVSEIESAIVERDDGEDLFLWADRKGCKGCKKEANALDRNALPKSIRVERVWIADSTTPGGNQVEGHYIYFPVVDEWQSVTDLKSLYKES